MRLNFSLNGEQVELETAGDALLLDLVRERGLIGAKEGCGVGVCGACTMLVDERPVSSCILPAGCVEGCDVWTVEGVAGRHPEIVAAFEEHEGLQCGACTSGQVVMAAALKLAGGAADEASVREYLAGNLCRCTGYRAIVESVRAAVAG
ncbi:MAG: 2Fe-2S iron-sulfur cluster binding domain-containing protein [Candidatus Dormibacteraeota bacterium]|nr:2Fe-2S iron-sulfur cluster binding domain-containing protein [Candidatus Dormibacteraeota bacterium]